MEIFKYDSYGHYVKAQTEANKIKIKKVYAHKNNFHDFVKYKKDAKNVLCHGSRNGAELQFFRDSYKKIGNTEVFVQGTDISDTATQFENTVQWDMMKPNPEWTGKWDVVYTNSFDHSFDPVSTLKVWSDQLTKDGVIILEFSFHSKHQSTARAWDPIGKMTREDMEQVIADAGLVIRQQETTQFGAANQRGETYYIGNPS